jgi:hypothetical protein
MLRIKLLTDYIPPDRPNLFYKKGDVFDASVIGDNAAVGIRQVFAQGNITGKPQVVNQIEILIPIPDDKFIVVEGEYTPKTNKVGTKNKYTSVKYIMLGIAVIGLLSYIAIKNKK